MAGYSSTPLSRKLGYKAGYRVELVDPPPHYQQLIAELPEGVHFLNGEDNLDLVHIFCNAFELLAKIFSYHYSSPCNDFWN